MICPNCGNECSTPFCANCGAKMPAVQNSGANGFFHAPGPGFETYPAPPAPSVSAPAGFSRPGDLSGRASGPAYGAPAAYYGAAEPVRYAAPPTYAPPEPPRYAAPVSYAPAEPARYAAPAAPVSAPTNGEALQVVRKMGSSGMFLTAVIAYSVAFILSIISAFSVSYREQLLYEFVRVSRGFNYAAAIVSLIPTMLMLLGMWLTFGASLSRGPRMSTAGLTIIKVMLIILQVLLAIAMGIVAIAFLIGMIAGGGLLSDLGMGDVAREGVGIMLVVLLVISLVYTLICIFIAKTIKTINTVKYTIQTDKASANVSPFVAVMCIIACVGMTVVGVAYFAWGNLLSALSILLSLVTTLCFAILIFRYRSAMAGITGNSGNPYYG